MGKAKTIKVTCKGSRLVDVSVLRILQGGLKQRTAEDIEKLKAAIKKLGFAFPFFVWKDGEEQWTLDGHGRMEALEQLRSEGWKIPPLPVVDIEAEDEADAKRKLLAINSRYGKITKAGMEGFLSGANVEDLAGIIQIPEVRIGDAEIVIDAKEEVVTIRPYTKMHVLLSFTISKARRVKAAVKALEDENAVEAAWGAN